MYHFNIIKLEEGGYRFELGPVKMYVDDFTVNNNGSHLLANPTKAIAFFNIDGNIYGVSNGDRKYNTAEEFYDSMTRQYLIFTKGANAGQNYKLSA